LLEALRRAGATFLDEDGAEETKTREQITKADLFELGLTGGADSARKRQELLKKLSLPEHLTANALLEALNLLYDKEDFYHFVEENV
jgi:ribonuclease M5